MNTYFYRATIAISSAVALCVALASPTFAAEVGGKDEVPGANVFQSKRDALSYAVGVNTARNLSKEGMDVNTEMVLKGMSDALNGNRTLMSEKEMRSAMSGLITDMRQKMRSNRKEAADTNKKAGDEFRATFAKQPDVVTLPNGVMYKIAKQGSGQMPVLDDTVQISYRGTLASGYEFDATPVGKSATMKVASMTKGLSEATRRMPVGSRWTVVVPPELAYGTRGVGIDIGPNETLIFDQELIAITK
jgi:FKBP-type peptidyl-prolyl cis-trans isomerase FklB